MTKTMKPCPFCGGKAVLHFASWPNGDVRWHLIKCNECKINGIMSVNKDKAIRHWNRRPSENA